MELCRIHVTLTIQTHWFRALQNLYHTGQYRLINMELCRIYVTQDEERREQWSKVTGTKFLYDVFLSHDHGGKGSSKTDKEGVRIMSSLFTDSFMAAQEVYICATSLSWLLKRGTDVLLSFLPLFCPLWSGRGRVDL